MLGSVQLYFYSFLCFLVLPSSVATVEILNEASLSNCPLNNFTQTVASPDPSSTK